MRIVNVIQRYPPAIGGAETWCQEVCRRLVQCGHEVEVLTLDVIEEAEFFREPAGDARSTALGPWDDDEGVRIRRFRRSIPFKTVWIGLFRLILDRLLGIYFYGPHSLEMYRRMGRHFRAADAIFLHTLPHPHNIVAYAWARILRKPVCIVPHFHPGHTYYERWLNYQIMRRCDALFAVSEFEREYLIRKGVAPERIATTGNGVHAADYQIGDSTTWKQAFLRRHGLSPRTRLVLFLGRKLAEKGIPELFDACERLATGRDVALILAGPDSDWYQSWPGRHSRILRAIDLGRVAEDDKRRLLATCDVLALPSHFEAFGIVVLEAWAAGTPVVASDFGAIPSVVGDGGLIVPLGDVRALATALARVIDDQELRRRLVQSGQQRLESQFRWDRIASVVERRMEECLAARSAVIPSDNPVLAE
jgi:glycosyltransferase involved in cell wall biosynthesis